MFKLRRKITVSLVALLVVLHVGSRDVAAVGPLQTEVDNTVQLMQRGAFQQALEPLRAAVAAYPFEPALRPLLVECTFGAALELLHQRAYADAAELLRRGQDLAPGEWRFWQLRGHELMLSGDLVGAEAELELAVIKGDGPVESLRLLARLFYQRGELARAQQRISEALEKAPDDAEFKSFSAQIERELLVDARMSARSGGNFTVSADGELNGDLGREVLAELERAYNATGNLFGLYPDVPDPRYPLWQ